MSAPRRLPVVATRRFERALEALFDHYDSLRHLHPDAGARALRLIDLVEGELPRLLGAQPNIGRPAQLSLTQSGSLCDYTTQSSGERLRTAFSGK